MTKFAYLFERFPSFGQTFCYREVTELARQGVNSPIFAIRNPKGEPPQNWDQRIVERVHYLPGEEQLLREVRQASKKGKLTEEVIGALDEWGRRTDFLRLYQAVYVGLRLQEIGIRHVHAHFAGMAARTAFWIGKFFPITFSFTAHANDIFAPRDFEIGLDKLVDATRVIITETDYAEKFLRERFPGRGDRIHRIYNGLDLAPFARADFSSTPPLIVAVGRLIAKKGFADLIRACRLLMERRKSFRCEIIGENLGTVPQEVNRAMDRHGHRKMYVVQFEQRPKQQALTQLPGAKPQHEIRKYFAAASAFVLPSVIDPDGGMDNLPTVIMEAMAAGLPVISTAVGGIPEMVIQSETGFLVPPGDVAALAGAIERLFNEIGLPRRLGERGFQRAKELFSIEKNVRSLLALIDPDNHEAQNS